MSKIMITGGGGYIGSILTGQLLEAGHDVVVLDWFVFGVHRLDAYKGNPKLTLLNQDVRTVKPSQIKDVEIICDLAALSNDPAGDLDANLTRQINFEARARLGRIAKSMGVKRYMLASSCSVYGANGDLAATEESQINPLTTYAECNALAEQALFELNDDDFCVTAFRNSTAFGVSPRMRFDLVVNIMTLNALNDQEITIHGDGLQHRPLIHIADISAAFVKAIESEINVVSGQVFNLGTTNVTIADLANTVAKILPMDIDIKYQPNNADARDYTVSFEKMRHRLGLNPKMQIENGITEVFHAVLHGETKLSPDTITLNRYKEVMANNESIIKQMKSISA